MMTTTATTFRTATYRKPRVIRTVTLEAQPSNGWTGSYVVLVHKGTGRTCWAANASTLTEAVAEFHRAIEWVESQGLAISTDSVNEAWDEALEAHKAWYDARELDTQHALALEETLALADDAELEALTSTEAAHLEATNSLPAYKTQDQIRAIRRAFESRAACPWTLGAERQPCQRWAGHPGGCVPEPLPVQGERVFQERGVPFRNGGFSAVRAAVRRQTVLDLAHMVALADTAATTAEEVALRAEAMELSQSDGLGYGGGGILDEMVAWMYQGPRPKVADPVVEGTGSVPPGGFPSPDAVATLVRMARCDYLVEGPTVSPSALGELGRLGYSVKIPGLVVHSITEAGREFARRWVLSPAASS